MLLETFVAAALVASAAGVPCADHSECDPGHCNYGMADG